MSDTNTQNHRTMEVFAKKLTLSLFLTTDRITIKVREQRNRIDSFLTNCFFLDLTTHMELIVLQHVQYNVRT